MSLFQKLNTLPQMWRLMGLTLEFSNSIQYKPVSFSDQAATDKVCWKADKREEDEDSVACWPVFNTALQRHGFVSGVLGYLRPASGRDPGLAGLSMWAQVESVVSELSLGIPQRKETTSYRRLFFHLPQGIIDMQTDHLVFKRLVLTGYK